MTKLINKNMKKVLGILSIFAIVALASCGNKANPETATGTDSTAVNLDSTAVTATDSTTAQIPAESPVEKK
jgi:hypothetical protein